MDSSNCEYDVETIDSKQQVLRRLPRERLRRPLPRGCHVKVFSPSATSDWHDATITQYSSDKHEYEVRLDTARRDGTQELTIKSEHILPCLPVKVAKTIRASAGPSADTLDVSEFTKLMDSLGVVLPSKVSCPVLCRPCDHQALITGSVSVDAVDRMWIALLRWLETVPASPGLL